MLAFVWFDIILLRGRLHCLGLVSISIPYNRLTDWLTCWLANAWKHKSFCILLGVWDDIYSDDIIGYFLCIAISNDKHPDHYICYNYVKAKFSVIFFNSIITVL